MPNKTNNKTKTNTNTKSNNTTKTTKTTNNNSTISILDQLGFWAVLALAVVMIINAFINFFAVCGLTIPSLSQATNILNKFAMAIAIGITIYCSYFAARKKPRKLYILWLVSAILVGLCFILGITFF
ncbi:MAG: hypothetical protein IJW32_05675 [Clostridia bacterium]|nr:hypothetical protein [Clostridia bacterium]